MNQCWNIVNLTIRNKLQWYSNQNKNWWPFCPERDESNGPVRVVSCTKDRTVSSHRYHHDDVIFRVTGHLCGEFTGPRWIPHTTVSDAELWFFSFICAWINAWVNNGEAGDLRRQRAHCDVIVMIILCTLRTQPSDVDFQDMIPAVCY